MLRTGSLNAFTQLLIQGGLEDGRGNANSSHLPNTAEELGKTSPNSHHRIFGIVSCIDLRSEIHSRGICARRATKNGGH